MLKTANTKFAGFPVTLVGLLVASLLIGLFSWLAFTGQAFATSSAVESKVGQAPGGGFMPIEKVIVEGKLKNLDVKKFEALIAQHAHSGFFSVNVAQIEKAATRSDWVRTASVRRIWPDTLKLSITEHEAVARWNDRSLINRHAEVFAPKTLVIQKDQPELKGPEGMHKQVLQQYLKLSPEFASLGLQIHSLEMDDRYSWRLVTGSKTEDYKLALLLGREHVDKSVERFIEAFSGPLAKNMKDIKYVDLRYTNGFAVRWNSGKAAVEHNKSSWRGNS